MLDAWQGWEVHLLLTVQHELINIKNCSVFVTIQIVIY